MSSYFEKVCLFPLIYSIQFIPQGETQDHQSAHQLLPAQGFPQDQNADDHSHQRVNITENGSLLSGQLLQG